MKQVNNKRRKKLKRKIHIRKRIFGTPERPRMSVYRSNKHLYVQVIDDTTGVTIASASNLDVELKALKNNVADAVKIGEAIGQKLVEKKIEAVVFDRNGYLYHGIVKSIADGARKSGLKF